MGSRLWGIEEKQKILIFFIKRVTIYKKNKEVIMVKKRMGISLSEEVAEMLEKQAREAGLNKSALITTLIVAENKRQLEK